LKGMSSCSTIRPAKKKKTYNTHKKCWQSVCTGTHGPPSDV